MVCALGCLQVWIVGNWLRGLWVDHYKVYYFSSEVRLVGQAMVMPEVWPTKGPWGVHHTAHFTPRVYWDWWSFVMMHQNVLVEENKEINGNKRIRGWLVLLQKVCISLIGCYESWFSVLYQVSMIGSKQVTGSLYSQCV
jgi:hypothetical protein